MHTDTSGTCDFDLPDKKILKSFAHLAKDTGWTPDIQKIYLGVQGFFPFTIMQTGNLLREVSDLTEGAQQKRGRTGFKLMEGGECPSSPTFYN